MQIYSFQMLCGKRYTKDYLAPESTGRASIHHFASLRKPDRIFLLYINIFKLKIVCLMWWWTNQCNMKWREYNTNTNIHSDTKSDTINTNTKTIQYIMLWYAIYNIQYTIYNISHYYSSILQLLLINNIITAHIHHHHPFQWQYAADLCWTDQ